MIVFIAGYLDVIRNGYFHAWYNCVRHYSARDLQDRLVDTINNAYQGRIFDGIHFPLYSIASRTIQPWRRVD